MIGILAENDDFDILRLAEIKGTKELFWGREYILGEICLSDLYSE
jgi:hypothetical protein